VTVHPTRIAPVQQHESADTMMLTIKWAGSYSTPGQAVTERHRLDGQRRERISVYIRKC